MGLRDYLEQRESELLTEIGDLHRKLAPLEAELAEVRRAKAAIGMPISDAAPADEKLLRSVTLERFDEVQRTSPYAHLTMKQLVVKALGEHFQHGAETRELVDFFRDAWGRDIARTNLSPQISRLYSEGVISRTGRLWVLTEALVERIHEADAERDSEPPQ